MDRVLNQTYALGKLIGSGGMSRVYSATHVRLGTVWAVKEISKKLELQLDITQEAEILKNLRHPNLVRIIDILEDEENVYVVEDFINGKTLETIINERPVDEETIISYFKTLCNVLIYLHSQKPNPVIYRDMKPANIMVDDKGELKLIDFGIARVYKNQSAGDTVAAGTTGYAAPEQFGKTQSDARTDIYSLGMTMFHLATGKSPYEPPYGVTSARKLNPKISVGLDTIIAKCIHLEPIDRYQTVQELLDDLDHIVKYDARYIAIHKKVKLRIALVSSLYFTSLLCFFGSHITHEKILEKNYLTNIEEAISLSDENQKIETLHLAESLIPDREDAYYEELRFYYQNQNFKELIYRFTELEMLGIANAEKMPDLYLLMGSAYLTKGDHDKSVELFTMVQETGFPFSVDQVIDYSAALLHVGEQEKSESLIQSLNSDVGEAQIDYLKGQIVFYTGDFLSAINIFKELISQNKDSSITSRAYISLIELYRDVAELDSSNENYMDNANELALSVVTQAQERPDLMNNSVLWEMKGLILYELSNDSEEPEGILREAATCFQNVLDLGIQKDYLYQNIFACLIKIPDYDAAQDILHKMKKTFPDSNLPYTLNSQLFIIEQNNMDLSQRDYSEAYSEYIEAKGKIKYVKNEAQLKYLEEMITQLRSGGWIE